jgi:hypothetical protein
MVGQTGHALIDYMASLTRRSWLIFVSVQNFDFVSDLFLKQMIMKAVMDVGSPANTRMDIQFLEIGPANRNGMQIATG